MPIIKSTDKLQYEVFDLASEIVLINPIDTPLSTMLYGRGQVVPAKDVTVTWRERELNNTRGTLKTEGAEAGDPIKTSRTMHSNICQILEKVTAVTGTSNVLRPEGVGDEFASELEFRLIELKKDIEWYFFNGVKTMESGDTPRQMDGLFNLIDSGNQIDLTGKGGQITEDVLLDGMQKVWNAGAQGEYYMFLNATEKRLINKLFAGQSGVRQIVTPGDNNFGVMAERVDTDFGTVNFVLNRYIPNGSVIGVDLSMVEIAELRPAYYEDLAKTGDYKKGHIISENTIKLLNSKAGFVINGITK